MYEQSLVKTVEPIKKTTITRMNRGKKWKYGYNKEHDLIVLSRRPHIEYYLYGGKETTKRINKIIDEGKLGDIYFVEYGKEEESDTLKINQ